MIRRLLRALDYNLVIVLLLIACAGVALHLLEACR